MSLIKSACLVAKPYNKVPKEHDRTSDEEENAIHNQKAIILKSLPAMQNMQNVNNVRGESESTECKGVNVNPH
jgi:hypothetical protein